MGSRMGSYHNEVFICIKTLFDKSCWFPVMKTLQFSKSMTGHLTESAVAEFWGHCAAHEEWRNHPCLNDASVPQGRPLTWKWYRFCCFILLEYVHHSINICNYLYGLQHGKIHLVWKEVYNMWLHFLSWQGVACTIVPTQDWFRSASTWMVQKCSPTMSSWFGVFNQSLQMVPMSGTRNFLFVLYP